MNCPAINGRVINGDTAFRHHLLEIARTQAVSQIPPDTQQDHRAIEMTAFEHCAPPDCVGGVSRTELLKGLQQIPVGLITAIQSHKSCGPRS